MKEVIVTSSYEVNNLRDLGMTHKEWIGIIVVVISKLKSGLYLVKNADGKETRLAKVNLTPILESKNIYNDIWRLSEHYTMSEILHQYEGIGINLTEEEFKQIKYK